MDFEKSMIEIAQHMGSTNARLDEGNERLKRIENQLEQMRIDSRDYMTQDKCKELHDRDRTTEEIASSMSQMATAQENIARIALKCRAENGTAKAERFLPQTLAGWVGLALALIALLGIVATAIAAGDELLALARQHPTQTLQQMKVELDRHVSSEQKTPAPVIPGAVGSQAP